MEGRLTSATSKLCTFYTYYLFEKVTHAYDQKFKKYRTGDPTPRGKHYCESLICLSTDTFPPKWKNALGIFSHADTGP